MPVEEALLCPYCCLLGLEFQSSVQDNILVNWTTNKQGNNEEEDEDVNS